MRNVGLCGARTKERSDQTEIDTFNSFLLLAQEIEASLQPSRSLVDLGEAEIVLNSALSDVCKRIKITHATLKKLSSEAGSKLSKREERVLQEIGQILAEGTRGLLPFTANDEQRLHWVRLVRDYQLLEKIAFGLHLREKRAYLIDTGLTVRLGEVRDRRAAALANECGLLLSVLNPTSLFRSNGGAEAVEARFERFRWSYAEYYSVAHARWRVEMERFAALIDEAGQVLRVLKRIESMPWFATEQNADSNGGARNSAALATRLTNLIEKPVLCERERMSSLETTPRCPDCRYVLGTWQAREKVDDLLVAARRILKAKLAAFSTKAIRRVVRLKDEVNRLKAILEIVKSGSVGMLNIEFDRLGTELFGQTGFAREASEWKNG